MLDHRLCLEFDRMFMLVYITKQQALRFFLFVFFVVLLPGFYKLKIAAICCVVLQYVEDKSFLYSLTHGVQTKRRKAAVCLLFSKYFECFLLWCSGKCKYAQVV